MTDVVANALAQVTGETAERCSDETAWLEDDLGVDSFALLELVEILQERLGISVPDEVTARLRKVGELQRAVHHLVAEHDHPCTSRTIS